jgi:hypothetical protein
MTAAAAAVGAVTTAPPLAAPHAHHHPARVLMPADYLCLVVLVALVLHCSHQASVPLTADWLTVAAAARWLGA